MSTAERPDTGGSGADCAPAVRDTRMQARAIRERWPLPADVRVKVLKRLTQIVDADRIPEAGEPRPGHREVIAAARALIAADRLNLEQAKLDMQADDDGTPQLTIVVRREDRGLVPPAPGPGAGEG